MTTTQASTNMSFIVNRKALNDALAKLAPSLSTRATLPILSNVLIEVTDEITLSTTNLEIGTRLQIPGEDATIVETGSLTVNYKELTALIKSIKDEEVYFSQGDTSQSHTVLLIEATNVKVAINGIDSSEYPLIPTLTYEGDKQQQITLPIETLRKMVTLTQFAAADDESRPVLTGINTRLKNDTLTMAAADAFRLAVSTEKIAGAGSWDFDVLIPATTLKDVSKQLPEAKQPKKTKKNPNPALVSAGNVTITISEKRSQAMFTHEGYTLVTRLIDGTFPRYEMIIPQECDCIAVCDIPTLKNAVETVKPIAKDSSNITHFTVNGHIDVSAQAENENWKRGDPEEQKMRRSQAIVPAETTNIEGEEYKIMLNNKYVLDFLTAHPQGNMVLELQKPTKHVLMFKGEPTETETPKPAKVLFPDVPGFTGVIMPMHVNR